MPGSRSDLIIFDCDGVLIDSEIISAETLIALVEPLGVAIDLVYVRQHFLGRSFPTVAETIRREFDVVLPPGFEASYRCNLLRKFEIGLRPTPGIETVLESLAVPFCVATSSSPERVRRSLDVVGLAKYFLDNIYTASQVENGKPAPDLFLYVADRQGVDPARCLVIEDSLPGLEAARAAGMEVWHFTGGSHFSAMGGAPAKGVGADRNFDSWADFSHMMAQGTGMNALGDRNDGKQI